MGLSTVDWIVMAIYFVFVLGIGFWLKKSIKTSTDFFLSGRSIPAWITGLAFISANLGAQEVIGMGAMGFMGSSMVVDCHIEVGYCHTGGMPISVHMFCLSSRRASARVHAHGAAEFRTDPMWFTDYSRRATVEWAGSVPVAAE